MSSFVTFAPTAVTAFSFAASFDGVNCTVVITWNTFGQRWYVNCYDASGALVFCLPLIGSGNTCFPLASLDWDIIDGGTVTATTLEEHGFPIGSVASLVISGCSPAAFNGRFSCAIMDATTFEFALPGDPGVATALGAVFDSVDLLAGYFNTSGLVYRQPLQQFVLTP